MNLPKHRDSYGVYYKLFISKYIPDDVEKLLYLDSDLIIFKNIESLFLAELNNNLMALIEHPIKWWLSELFIEHTGNWFACGVNLINLKEWRNQNCEETIIHSLTNNIINDLFTADEDIVNLLFSDNIAVLDYKYNYVSCFKQFNKIEYIQFLFEFSNEIKERIIDASNDIHIFHCLEFLTFRPWHITDVFPFSNEWDHYLDISPWSGYKKQEKHLTFTGKINVLLYKYCPDFFYSVIFKFRMKQISQREFKNLKLGS